MASLINDPNGFRRIQLQNANGVRKTIRLGKVDKKTAQYILRHIEEIQTSNVTNQSLRLESAIWLSQTGDSLKSKLIKAGLIAETRRSEKLSLRQFLISYVEKRTDIKPASVISIQQTVKNLVNFFGEDKQIDLINSGDAEDFKRWLSTKARSQSQIRKNSPGLAQATVSKRLQVSMTLFNDAVKRELIPKNPFLGIKQPKNNNSERQEYIPYEIIEKLITESPSQEWKLLLALSRYLGLRVPSEPFSMTWDCVDWEKQRLRIPSPKTEVHGKSFRIVPILPQVKTHLENLFENAAEGSKYVFESLRERDSIKKAEIGFWSSVNLRQQLLRMLKRAGIKPWPKLWHNLRSSAQTDLADKFPIHVVCDWLGNTRIIAQNHYLQTTDEHFEKANQKAAQKAAHQPAEMSRIGKKLDEAGFTKIVKLPEISIDCNSMNKYIVGEAGLEPARSLGTGDFKSPASAIPPLAQRINNL